LSIVEIITYFEKIIQIDALWNPSWFQFSKAYLVGNGGFSLRSRSKTLALLARVPYNQKIPEDVWYASNLHRFNGRIPYLLTES
jgi:hypothetical protein